MPAQRRISRSQLQTLLSHMEANKNMAKGRLLQESGPLGKQKQHKEWEDLANKLNSHGDGATKCAKEWRIYWNNLKYKARAKNSERRRHMAGTGGGPAWEKGNLTEEEWRILNILGRECILGNESVAIPFDVQDDEPLPSTSAQTCSPPALAEPVFGLVDAQPATPTVSPPDVPSEQTPRTYVRRAHIPEIPDWAREVEERNSAAQERIALALERMLENQTHSISLQQDTSATINRLLDNQQQLLRLLQERLPTFVEES